jgi:hypothetical protein
MAVKLEGGEVVLRRYHDRLAKHYGKQRSLGGWRRVKDRVINDKAWLRCMQEAAFHLARGTEREKLVEHLGDVEVFHRLYEDSRWHLLKLWSQVDAEEVPLCIGQ